MAPNPSQTSSSRISNLLDRLIGPQPITDMKNPTGPKDAPATAEVPPPTYSEATESAPYIAASPRSHHAELGPSDSASSSDSRPRPPSDAQPARAPLRIKTTNSKISGHYIVTSADKGGRDSSDKPHVFLETTNAKIDAALWADDCDWDGSFSVCLESTNGRIVVPVHTVLPAQPVSVFAKTTNATNTVYLPSDFAGTILLKTTNSSASLSPSLQAHSVRVPCNVAGAECYEIRGSGGSSRVELRSTNGKVCAAQVDDIAAVSDEAAKDGSSCVCM